MSSPQPFGVASITKLIIERAVKTAELRKDYQRQQDYIADVSHEIRNLAFSLTEGLSAIIINLEMQSEQKQESADPTINDALTEIKALVKQHLPVADQQIQTLTSHLDDSKESFKHPLLATAIDTQIQHLETQTQRLELARKKFEPELANHCNYFSNAFQTLQSKFYQFATAHPAVASSKYIQAAQKNIPGLLTCIEKQLKVKKNATDRLADEAISPPTSPFSLGRTMEDAKTTMSPQLKNRSLHIRTRSPLPVVEADEVRISNIINNFIRNAIKFTDEDTGEIFLEFNAEPVPDKKKIKVTIRVIDNGIGIEESQQQRIGTKFAQANDTISKNYGGTGIGVNNCDKWAREMGGYAKLVGSKAGTGSIFECMVYCDIPPFTPGKNILIAEDNETIGNLMQGIFNRKGFTCKVVKDGQEAIDCWQATIDPVTKKPFYDAILMDMIMSPGKDGVPATREIRNMEQRIKSVRIPIIGLTGNDTEEDRRSCLSSDMDRVLIKPFAWGAFESVFQELTAAPVKQSDFRPPPLAIDEDDENAIIDQKIATLLQNISHTISATSPLSGIKPVGDSPTSARQIRLSGHKAGKVEPIMTAVMEPFEEADQQQSKRLS